MSELTGDSYIEVRGSIVKTMAEIKIRSIYGCRNDFWKERIARAQALRNWWRWVFPWLKPLDDTEAKAMIVVGDFSSIHFESVYSPDRYWSDELNRCYQLVKAVANNTGGETGMIRLSCNDASLLWS